MLLWAQNASVWPFSPSSRATRRRLRRSSSKMANSRPPFFPPSSVPGILSPSPASRGALENIGNCEGRSATREICVSQVHVSESPSPSPSAEGELSTLAVSEGEEAFGADFWRQHVHGILAPSGRFSATVAPWRNVVPTSWCLRSLQSST